MKLLLTSNGITNQSIRCALESLMDKLTAIRSMEKQHWMPQLEEADAIMIGGGDAPYLLAATVRLGR
jgi:hypothetical protein